MGDRADVDLHIPEAFSKRAKLIAYTTDFSEIVDGISIWTYEDINYGKLPFLDELEKAGIPFNSCWGSGFEYTSGTDYLRFNAEGEAIRFSNYAGDEDPPMDSLLDRIDTPDILRAYILEYKARTTPLPWDNQEEYSKLYLAIKLLTAT